MLFRRRPYIVIRELKQRRRRRQRERQKSNMFRLANNNFTRALSFFVHFLQWLPDYNVKLPIFTFCGGREHKTTIFFFFFWTLISWHSFRIQLQKNSLLFAELNEME